MKSAIETLELCSQRQRTGNAQGAKMTLMQATKPVNWQPKIKIKNY